MPPRSEGSYVFGRYRLDVRERRLLRDGQRVAVPPKAFDLLVALASRAGHLVTKEELLKEVWPDAFVEEANLSYTISLLRKTLGDEPERYIETVPKRGYRFLETVRPAADPAHDGGGENQRAAAESARHARARRRRTLFWSGVTAVSLAAAILIAARGGLRPVQPRHDVRIQSLAVLSLSNLTGDAQQDFFAEGLTEAVGTELSQIRSLRIISGRSSSRYKNREKSTTEIARELGVDAIVEGAVVRSGNRIRVTIHLVDGRTDQRILTNRFDRQLGDILHLYSDIAGAVASAIRATVTQTDGQRLSRSQTVNPAAYEAYLRGEYFRKRWQAGGCHQAEPYLLAAITQDPMFAPPYAARAYCYAYPDRLGRPGPEIYPIARAAAVRALELDERLAAGHQVLAAVQQRLEYDWQSAERSLRRALDLDPRHVDAHIMLGEYLYAIGRPDDGIASMRRGLELDPFHLGHGVALGFALRNIRRYGEAIEQLEATVKLDPHWSTAHLWLAESYASIGREREAVATYISWLRQVLVPQRVEQVTASLLDVYSRSGWRAFWTRELELAEEERTHPGTVWTVPQNQYCGAYYLARRHARLGDDERALDSLERAYAERHHLMVFLQVEPLFDSLRSHPQFQDLARRVKIPQTFSN